MARFAFTTKDLARQSRNQRRKDFTAETRSSQSSEYILIKKFSTRRPLRLCGELSENLRKPSKLSCIVVHTFSQTGLGKRGSPVGEQPVFDSVAP